MANPVARLNEFYQRARSGALPSYDFIAAPPEDLSGPRFVCNLTLPACEDLASEVFQGEGRKKQQAKNHAADLALEWLQLQPAYVARAKPAAADGSLGACLANAVAQEARDAELRGYALWARQHNGGVLPVTAFSHARSVRSWFRAQRPELHGDHAAMAAAMRAELVASPLEGIVLAGDAGLQLPPAASAPPALTHEIASPGPLPLVRLPADAREPPQEVLLEGGGDLLGKLAPLLGAASPTQVVVSGLVGRRVHRAALPDDPALAATAGAEQAARGGDPEGGIARQASAPSQEPPAKRHHHSSALQWVQGGAACHREGPAIAQSQLTRWMVTAASWGCTIAGRPSEGGATLDSCQTVAQRQGPAAMDWDVAHADAEVKQPDHAATEPAAAATRVAAANGSVTEPEPTLYQRLAPAAEEVPLPLNLRATWLAGRPVHGDVLLSLCRIVTLGPTAVVKWRPYTEVALWRSLSAVFPSGQYRLSAHALLLRRLPALYSCSTAWLGPTPKRLLAEYCRRAPWRCGEEQYKVQVADADSATDAFASVTVRAFGTGQPVVALSARAPSQDAACQQAALAALHLLEVQDAAALLGQDPLLSPALLHTNSFAAVPLPQASSAAHGGGGALCPEQQRLLQQAAAAAEGAVTAAVVAPAAPGQPGSAAGEGVAVLQRSQGLAVGGHARGVEVLKQGRMEGPTPGPGLVIKVTASVSVAPGGGVGGAAAGGDSCVLEENGSLVYEQGSGAVAPAVEELAALLGVEGVARCRVSLALEGADPLARLQRHECLLEVRLRGVSVLDAAAAEAAGGAGGRPAARVFDPPLSRQRCDLVARVAGEAAAATVVDLGCGEGRVLAHLLSSCAFTPLHTLVGIDCSASGLAGAAKRISALVAASPAMEEAVAPLEVSPWSAGGNSGDDADARPPASVRAGPAPSRGGGALPQPTTLDRLWSARSSELGGASEGPAAAVAGGGSIFTSTANAAAEVRSQLASASVQWAPPAAATDAPRADGGASAEAETAAARAASPAMSLAMSSMSVVGRAGRANSVEAPGGSTWRVDVALLRGSFVGGGCTLPGAWGTLRGADLVLLVEVVEHLYPSDMALVAPCVLGGLRPRVLLVTTPNWDYNKVLRAVEGGGNAWGGPPGRDGTPMRNSDHKWEWTRAEFEAWAEAAAEAFGYVVTFEEVGHVVDEERVLARLAAGVAVEAEPDPTELGQGGANDTTADPACPTESGAGGGDAAMAEACGGSLGGSAAAPLLDVGGASQAAIFRLSEGAWTPAAQLAPLEGWAPKRLAVVLGAEPGEEGGGSGGGLGQQEGDADVAEEHF